MKTRSIAKTALISISFAVLIVTGAFIPQQQITTMSMNVISKTLSNGQSASGEGEIYYTTNNGGEMLSRVVKPLESFMFVNSKGELKIYNPKDNSVIIQTTSGISSQSSFMYYFLSGNQGDMGLKLAGFTIADTKIEDNLVITTWMPSTMMAGILGKAELVHENYKPVYMAYYNSKNEPVLKIYYSSYTKIQDISFPTSVTEFRFKSPTDSVIEKKIYSNIQINENVDDKYLNFKIPLNAKVITSGK